MSHGFSQIDAETIEIKIKDINGMEFVIKMGEKGRRLHVDTAMNVEYSDVYHESIAPRYTFPESREYVLKVRF